MVMLAVGTKVIYPEMRLLSSHFKILRTVIYKFYHYESAKVLNLVVVAVCHFNLVLLISCREETDLLKHLLIYPISDVNYIFLTSSMLKSN